MANRSLLMRRLLGRNVRPVLAALVVLGTASVPLGLASLSASASGVLSVWTAGGEAQLPANAATSGQDAWFNAVSCPAPGDCVAAGYYVDTSGDEMPMVATESGGVFARAIELALPGNAKASGQFSSIGGISCTAPGSCSVAGSYLDNSSAAQALVATETGGVFATALEVTPPSDALSPNPGAQLNGISCTSPGACVAVGGYNVAAFSDRPMFVNLTGGTPATALEASLPSNADMTTSGGASLLAVSCPSTGNCTAGGHYRDLSGNTDALAVTESSGVLAPGVEVGLPSNAATTAQGASLKGISCTAPGSCGASGDYYDSTSHSQAMLVTLTGGAGTGASEVTLPPNATGTVRYVGMESISCSAPGTCSAAGAYFDTSGNTEAMVVSESGGAPAPATELGLPANAAGSSQRATLGGIGCTAAGVCTAVGYYVDGAGATQAMVATSEPVLSLATSTLPPAERGHPYRAQLAAGGGAGSYSFTVTAGTLPSGLSLDGSNGTLSGTPTSGGTASFTVQVADPGPPSQLASVPLQIQVLVPTVVLLGHRLVNHAGVFQAVVGCRSARCTGSVTFRATIVSGKGSKRHTRHLTVASTSFDLAAGAHANLRCRLDRIGRRLLAAGHGRFRVNETVRSLGARSAAATTTLAAAVKKG